MKFTVDYPITVANYDPAFATADGLTRTVQTAENLGFDAIAFSEHPAPSAKWLNAGGHESLHQTSALAFCAAVTSRIQLMPYLMVVPYHNPFLAAKALTTVDLLSGGRVTVVAGTGYLRSEFRALNVDFDQRNEIFDEALEVMQGVWAQSPFDHEGARFRGVGVASLPAPSQAGGPPILVGGNSARSRWRAAHLQGWSPLMISPEMAKTSRTPGIATIGELAQKIFEVRLAAADLGTVSTTIQVHTPQVTFIQKPGSVEEHRDHLGQLADAGADRFVVRPPAGSVEQAIDAMTQYAETFLH